MFMIESTKIIGIGAGKDRGFNPPSSESGG